MAEYGVCYKCQSDIKIPGLDAYLCSGNCGWVEHLWYKKFKLENSRNESNHRKSQSRKTATSERMSAAFDEDSESSLFLETID